jgi:hypothetical protein
LVSGGLVAGGLVPVDSVPLGDGSVGDKVNSVAVLETAQTESISALEKSIQESEVSKKLMGLVAQLRKVRVGVKRL